MELCGVEDEDILGCDTWHSLVDTFTVGVDLHMGFVDQKKNIKYTYR